MSEQLLKAVIRLFALLAKVDGITEYEKTTIKEFLLHKLNEDQALKYFEFFEELLALPEPEESDKYSEILKTSRQINIEFTQQQKIILVLDLVSLMIADGMISEGEKEIVGKIGEAIRMEQEIIDTLTAFAMANDIQEYNANHFLIVADNEDTIPDQAKRISEPGLDGFIAILELKKANSLFMKYLGKSPLYLNGVPIKSGLINMFSTGSTIRGENIKPVYYSDVVSGFKEYEADTKISFVAENIGFRFIGGNIGLRNVSIQEESGKLIGLMGSSGAGKSTLLNVLNGNEKPTEGTVLINGIDIHKERHKVEGVIGYVPQDDLLMEDLTVFQNLYYAGKLCFSNLSKEEIEKLVDKTLSNLGLLEIKNLKVGSPLNKKISGGQRKRLNIGLELLREPAVMFVDEPTSGLSSRDSENIMDLLKELTLKGKLIFCVIHQPSSDIFKMFDRLVILDVGGYQIYYGNPIESVVYFKEAFKLIGSDQGSCVRCGNVNPEQVFNIIETKVVNEYGRLTTERKVTPKQWNHIYEKRLSVPQIEEHHEELKMTLHIPNRVKQGKVFITRDVLSKISNRQYMIINLLEAPLLAFLLAAIVRYFPAIGDDGGSYFFGTNVNIPAYIFMSVIVALFMGLTVSAEEIIKDLKILKRESFLNLSRSSYIFSKLAILFTLSAIQTLTYTMVGNYILEIHNMFIPMWLILFTSSCFANVLGLNISSSFDTVVTIYILIPILLIPQILLSGVVVKFDELNPRITSNDKVPIIGDVMTSRWAFEAAMVTQFTKNQYESMFYELDKQMGNAEYKNIYYLPTLSSKLDFVHKTYQSQDPEEIQEAKYNLDLLTNEIGKELDNFGAENFPELKDLEFGRFSNDTYEKTKDFIAVLKRVYINRYNKANKEKEDLLKSVADSPGKREHLDILKKLYQNERIVDMVKKSTEAIRISEINGQLIQKIYPIYMDPENPEHAFDYRAPFYVPVKHFLGGRFDTLRFNVTVIWVISIVLIITLYYDVLRKTIEYSSNISFRKEKE
ncbi:ATP-binding cassette domain-containing protein [Bacteroidota bacterium]